jgi:AcrR family transcriptional regulator
MPRLNPDLQTHQRDRVLAAAVAVIARTGFDRATMAEIASEAGMSVGNLYRYFANKEALILAFAEAERERAAQLIARAAAGGDIVALFGEAVREMLAECTPTRIAVDLEIIAEAARPGPLNEKILAGEAETHTALAALIETARVEGRLPPTGADPATGATMMLALYDGVFSRRCFAPAFEVDAVVKAAQAALRSVLIGHVRAAR